MILKKSMEVSKKFKFEEIEKRIGKLIETPVYKCPSCNLSISQGISFCPSCGEEIIWCPKCSTPNSIHNKFCIEDGYLLKPLEEIRNILEEKSKVRSEDLKTMSEKEATQKLKEFYDKFKVELNLKFENDALRIKKERIKKTIICPNCKAEINSSMEKCSNCGYKLIKEDIEEKISDILKKWGSISSNIESLRKEGFDEPNIKNFYLKYRNDAKKRFGFEIELLEDGTLIKK